MATHSQMTNSFKIAVVNVSVGENGSTSLRAMIIENSAMKSPSPVANENGRRGVALFDIVIIEMQQISAWIQERKRQLPSETDVTIRRKCNA